MNLGSHGLLTPGPEGREEGPEGHLSPWLQSLEKGDQAPKVPSMAYARGGSLSHPVLPHRTGWESPVSPADAACCQPAPEVPQTCPHSCLHREDPPGTPGVSWGLPGLTEAQGRAHGLSLGTLARAGPAGHFGESPAPAVQRTEEREMPAGWGPHCGVQPETVCPDSAEVEPRGWRESHGGCGVVSGQLCDRPLSQGRRKPCPAGVWMPPTWGRGSISKLSLGHHLWPWRSDPRTKDRASQTGASPGLTDRHPPFGGNCFWEREIWYLWHLPCLPCWGHAPHLLPRPGGPQG